MGRQEKPEHGPLRFRATPWPGGPLPVPQVTRAVLRLTADGDGVQYLQTAGAVELPAELAVREVPRLAPDNQSALVAFMEQWGPLTAWPGNPGALLPRREQQEFVGLEVFDDPRNDIAPIKLVSAHVRALQAVIEHWDSYNNERDDAGVLRAWPSNGFNKPRSIGVAWDWWTDHLNAALAPFRLQVIVESDDATGTLRHGWERPPVTAYSALALQVFNDVSTGTAWRHCANEPCRNLFVRQRGRADHDQNRSTGVKYCTSNCAKAQVQRELRRRRALERQKGKGNA